MNPTRIPHDIVRRGRGFFDRGKRTRAASRHEHDPLPHDPEGDFDRPALVEEPDDIGRRTETQEIAGDIVEAERNSVLSAAYDIDRVRDHLDHSRDVIERSSRLLVHRAHELLRARTGRSVEWVAHHVAK